MPIELRWRPIPPLVLAAIVLLLPAAAVWVAALASALGLVSGAPDFGLVALPLAQRRLIFWALTLLLPAGAGVAAALGVLGGVVRAEGYELSARLALPRPPLGLGQVLGLLILVAAAGLFVAMAGHLAADCILGGDCA